MHNFFRIASTALIVALGTMLPTQTKAEVTSWKTVGDWDVDFYSGLPGCLASTNYEGGTLFMIGFIKRDDKILLDVTLMDDAWASIENGKEYNVKVFFGDETPWTLEMTGRDFNGNPGLTFSFDASTEQSGQFAREFMKETEMKWYYRNTMLGHYSLRGSRQAFDTAVECQKSFHEAVSGLSDPFGGSSGNSNTDPFSQ
ncbi:hypothetical protein [Lutimaribacter saemankumensis]|uniref:Uncharacterized protein n=1 Tax=Lutimaribacter saemankumensis TaxID=490829 RepID=A0A1G8RJ75_9RHOB|nr:hypothetical protein [Lutimaribacter saemankumensis]SDJ16575.1 hypothetical protein SAMN05421850_109130 [Lutimaribacter saemankumensis]